MKYNFLILVLLFLVPGIVIYGVRKDLRPVIRTMSLCSLPFAFTEFLFYPSYWEPVFLFDLGKKIGFGIEDFLFVIGLASFTSTVYAFILNLKYKDFGSSHKSIIMKRLGLVLGMSLLLIVVFVLLNISMIYGSFLVMLLITGFICLKRSDLALPGFFGGVFSLLLYTFLCIGFGLLIPGVFQLTWHTERFMNIFILGIPVEEMMYGFAAGTVATVFYPYVFNKKFV